MKPQDLLFFAFLLFFIIFKKGKYLYHAGLISFALAGLLFAAQNLFTSQRLSWYALGFIAVFIIIQSYNLYQKKNSP